jgi:hypothetical protein
LRKEQFNHSETNNRLKEKITEMEDLADKLFIAIKQLEEAKRLIDDQKA